MQDPTAAFDQFGAALLNMAVMFRDYFDKLTDCGFTQDQAFHMVLDAQREILRNAKAGD